jgi:hypothetical protein
VNFYQSTLAFAGVIQSFLRNLGDYLAQYYTRDFGRSWSGPITITSTGQVPGGSFLSKDDVILTYGSRSTPFGVGAKISRDDGFSYDESTKVSLVWDAPPVTHGGYANGVVSAGGNIYIVYYSMPPSPTYKGLWMNSEVRLLKLNSQVFFGLFHCD